jgi:two-component system, LytTR family, response regulator
LIDDEPPARRKLRHLLDPESDFAVVGEAGSGKEAVQLLEQTKPDVAFLDIQLPDCSGFDVLDVVPARDSLQVVFVTAHDAFALQAFEAHAIDYLLKPVEPSRFARSVQRVRRLFQQGEPNRMVERFDALVQELRTKQGYARRLLIGEGERSLFLEVSRIEWIESARNYACIHSGGRTYILRSSLEAIASKLDPAQFRRINRSELVNLEHIQEVRSWSHGDQKVVLKSGEELNWSRRYRAASKEDLERG